MTSSEASTLHFYQWEYRNRGYYLFGTPIDIEPPYIPYYHKAVSYSSSFDDGRVPSIFEQLIDVFKSKKPKITKKEEDSFPLNPHCIDINDIPLFSGFSLSFPNGADILPHRNIEFLSMLSFSDHPISFEIVGTYDDIQIQIVCSVVDNERISSQLSAYFPTAIIREIDVESFGFDDRYEVAIADFGLNNEFIRTITATDSFGIDPLTSIIATMDSLQQGDIIVFQMLFKGITSPLAKDITYAVSDGTGGSFFSNAPEMPQCAKEKISQLLFSVVMRVATQGSSDHRSQYLAQELSRSISSISKSEFNKLIPLSNEGYAYDFHHFNLHHRTSNRLGFILNAKELSTFAHYPNKTVVSTKLGIQGSVTKRVAQKYLNEKYTLGINQHYGESYIVGVNDEARLRHTHIIGSTGVGKSTLIANMILEDMRQGNGCCLFDPHGDIVEDILLRIPEYRQKDVILIDPSYLDFPIGFNLLHASTEAEKMVLSSDLVGAFKRFSTSWGDNMSAVLSQAINTFLESTKGGTLIELKRFLLEDDFRDNFLEYVNDPSIHYYWNNEYQFVRKGIAPLLTRIDTFLRPKIIRYMFAQQHGVDFRACIEEKKILLIKLSQGLIGEENSYLLGSLFLSKFNQVAQGRQQLEKHQRHPYYIYLDEFQNFMTNSITSILSGARKYGIGLILAHQELAQIDDSKILNSVISNSHIRICFHLGDRDAKYLESGFSGFEAQDLQSLTIGEAIIRIGSSEQDCNITTNKLTETTNISDYIRQSVIENSQKKYGKSRIEIEGLLEKLLPNIGKKKRREITKDKESQTTTIPKEKKKETYIKKKPSEIDKHFEPKDIPKSEKEKLIKAEELSVRNRDHNYLQNLIKKMGEERNYIATIEKQTSNGGRIDITLEKDTIKIAFEISITNTPQYEVQNIRKCLADGYLPVIMVSKNKHHLDKIETLAKKELSKKDFTYLLFIQPNQISKVLDQINTPITKNRETIKGFRITTEYDSATEHDSKSIRARIIKLLSKKK